MDDPATHTHAYRANRRQVAAALVVSAAVHAAVFGLALKVFWDAATPRVMVGRAQATTLNTRRDADVPTKATAPVRGQRAKKV